MPRKIVSLGMLFVAGLLLFAACGGQETAPVVEPVANTETVETAVDEPAAEPESSSSSSVRTFTIVPDQSEASYAAEEEFFNDAVAQLGVQLGLANPIGSTQEIEGELQLDLTQPNPFVSGEFEVNIQSLTSDKTKRDETIRKRFLESNQFPLAQFTITALEGFPEAYTEGEEATFQMMGEMTIREVTQPVTFAVTAVLDGDTISGTASAEMKMTDYGFNPPDIAGFFTVEDDFTVVVSFTATE